MTKFKGILLSRKLESDHQLALQPPPEHLTSSTSVSDHWVHKPFGSIAASTQGLVSSSTFSGTHAALQSVLLPPQLRSDKTHSQVMQDLELISSDLLFHTSQAAALHDLLIH